MNCGLSSTVSWPQHRWTFIGAREDWEGQTFCDITRRLVENCDITAGTSAIRLHTDLCGPERKKLTCQRYSVSLCFKDLTFELNLWADSIIYQISCLGPPVWNNRLVYLHLHNVLNQDFFLEAFLFSGPKLHMTPSDHRRQPISSEAYLCVWSELQIYHIENIYLLLFMDVFSRDSYSVMKKVEPWEKASLLSFSSFFSWNSPCLCSLKMKINSLRKNVLVRCVIESCWTTLALNIFGPPGHTSETNTINEYLYSNSYFGRSCCFENGGGQHRSYKKKLFVTCLYRLIDISQPQSFLYKSTLSSSPPPDHPRQQGLGGQLVSRRRHPRHRGHPRLRHDALWGSEQDQGVQQSALSHYRKVVRRIKKSTRTNRWWTQ